MENPPFVDHFLRLFPSACHIVSLPHGTSGSSRTNLLHNATLTTPWHSDGSVRLFGCQMVWFLGIWTPVWTIILVIPANGKYGLHMLNHVCPILFIPAYIFELVIDILNNPLPTLQIAKGRSAMSIHNVALKVYHHF